MVGSSLGRILQIPPYLVTVILVIWFVYLNFFTSTSQCHTSLTAWRTCSLLGKASSITAIIEGVNALVRSGGSSNVSANASDGGGDGAEANELETDQLLEFEVDLARLPPR